MSNTVIDVNSRFSSTNRLALKSAPIVMLNRFLKPPFWYPYIVAISLPRILPSAFQFTCVT